MGKKDRLPVRCAVRLTPRPWTFVAPEDARKDDPRDLKRVSKAFSQWCTTEWAAWRRFRETRKRPQVPVADIPL